MSSPSKKRKLNTGGKQHGPSTRGLEFFFAKQRQSSVATSSADATDVPDLASTELSDEELARKLQDEWNKEVADESKNETENTRSASPASNLAIDELSPAVQPELEPRVTKEAELSASKGATLTLQSTGMAEDAITTNIPLDESPLKFQPSKYLDLLREHWVAEGGNASYALLTRCFVLVSSTASRIKIVDTLVNCLRLLIEGDPSSLLPAVSSSTPMPFQASTHKR